MERSRNSLVWIGFLVILAGIFSYLPIFIHFDSTRDFPWVNLLLFAIGGAMLTAGVRRAYRQPERYRGKLSGAILSVLAVALVGIFLLGSFVFARRLPASANSPRVGSQAPAFTLPDASGKPVALADLLHNHRGALLVFYRGYW